MAEEQEVSVVVVPDPPIEDVKIATPATPSPAADGEGQAVEDLKEQLQALRSQRDAAEQRASSAMREAETVKADLTKVRGEAIDSQADTVAAGLDAAKTEAEAAAAEHLAALEAGDFAKAAAATRKLAKAEAKIVRLEEAHSDFEERRKQSPPQSQTGPQTARQQASSDPTEDFIASRTPPTQRWLREHRDWLADDRKRDRLTAAHHVALADGQTPDTDGYFAAVEQFLGLKDKPVAASAPSPAPTSSKRASPPAAAPVNGGPGGSGSPMRVELTRAEANSATDGTLVWNYDDPSGQKRFKKGDPIGIPEMARRKALMKAQGVYDRVYTDQ